MSAVDRYTHRLRVLAFLFRFKLIHGTFSNFLFRNSLVHILAPKLMTMWHACVCVCVCVYEYIRNTHLCLNFIYLLIVQKTKTQRELGLIVPHDQQQREFFYFVFFLGSWLSGFGFVTYRRSTRRVSDADINSDSDADSDYYDRRHNQTAR